MKTRRYDRVTRLAASLACCEYCINPEPIAILEYSQLFELLFCLFAARFIRFILTKLRQ
jgi:hypothetical protein